MTHARLRIDFDAVRHNVAEWRRYVAPREVWAVVKANAYGLGLVDVARACLDAGARRLCVIDLDEARALRAAGVTAPIVHIAATPPSDFADAIALDVAATIEDRRGAQTLDELATKLKKNAIAHVAIDTGSGWSGLQPPQVRAFAKTASGLKHVVWEGVWTHIASIDSMELQLAAFRRGLELLREAGMRFQFEHVASTGPAIVGAMGNAVRIGIGLYGSTDEEQTLALDLKQALEFRASVSAVKRFEEETPLGYGGAYVARAGDLVATIRAGYADGVPRGLGNRGNVLIDGERCPIVGTIGMNFTMVKLLPDSRVRVGEDALMLGEEDGLRLEDVAKAAGIIPHELVVNLAHANLTTGAGATA